MKFGIFGGSFNPPHIGHLIFAECALHELQLDSVLFIPAYLSPFKLKELMIDAESRCEMVRLAIIENNRFKLDLFETLRESASFTIETIRHLAGQYPNDTFTLLMGADAFQEFHLWKNPNDIIDYVTLGVALRPGYKVDLVNHPFGKHAKIFSMPLIEISATDIRRRIKEGSSIRYFVPEAVRAFIEKHALYR